MSFHYIKRAVIHIASPQPKMVDFQEEKEVNSLIHSKCVIVGRTVFCFSIPQ